MCHLSRYLLEQIMFYSLSSRKGFACPAKPICISRLSSTSRSQHYQAMCREIGQHNIFMRQMDSSQIRMLLEAIRNRSKSWLSQKSLCEKLHTLLDSFLNIFAIISIGLGSVNEASWKTGIHDLGLRLKDSPTWPRGCLIVVLKHRQRDIGLWHYMVF
jgi:hypothetical protein